MTKISKNLLIFLLAATLLSATATASGWLTGTARTDITPVEKTWMAGYASRMEPAHGTLQDIHARALALQDEDLQKFVMISVDVLGFPATFSKAVADRIQEKLGIPRENIILAATHTHEGPVVGDNLFVAYRMEEEHLEAVKRYTKILENKLVDTAVRSFSKMQPSRLSFGRTKANFAINRRVIKEDGIANGANRIGPVDHRVPFMAIDSENGALLAIVFSYACHNTTGRGQLLYNGDYAGFAEMSLEKEYPGITAMFIAGTAGDSNPYPRGSHALAERHGNELSEAIQGAITGPLKNIEANLEAGFREITLKLETPPEEAEFRSKLEDENEFVRRHARMMLDRIERDGELSRDFAYPVQAWNFGNNDLTLVAMGGEVVLDYTILLEKAFPGSDLWVAGYCNDVSAYIPSRRILSEGGYEAEGAMLYYGWPSTFEPSVEDMIVKNISDLIAEEK
jgi:Neutral/alkaline non-lysosomal ceramidase, N-terminal